MKRYKIYSILAFLALALISCEDYLDKNPESDLTADKVYSDYERFAGVVDRISGLLHNYGYSEFDYGNEVGTYSDECQQANTKWGGARTVLDQVNTGNWLNSKAPGFDWKFVVGDDGDNGYEEFHYRKWSREVPGESVTAIRACNLALENAYYLETFPDESIYSEEELRSQLLGQVYFYRAWFYFMIIRDYGGYFNMQTSFPTDYDFDLERPEYWESSEWAVQDLDNAIDMLPERWALPKDLGRSTKTTAKALKQMVLLYQASPNMQIPRDQSLGFNGPGEYDEATLIRAEAAGVAALASALDGASRYRMYTDEEYSDNFAVKKDLLDKIISDEAIFQPPHSAMFFDETNTWTGSNASSGTGWYMPWFDGEHTWCGYAVPTHNAVDWFETAEGYAIEDVEANPALDPTWSSDDPYSNRDPRLKKFIFCQGDKMYNRDDVPSGLSNYGLGLTLNAVEGEGHNNAEDEKSFLFTGFYQAGKFRWWGNNRHDTDLKAQGYTYIFSFIRFAQLYLDLAEIANELHGPTGPIAIGDASVDVTSAVDCINKVRNRIGMDDVQGMYLTDKETFRDYIRKERARELYTEQHRWWDIRRWRIAKEELGKGIWVTNITKNTDGTLNYGKKKSTYTRVFENKHYWYPFAETEMYLYENFEQNPGW